MSARSELSLNEINPFHVRTHSHQKGSLCQPHPVRNGGQSSPKENGGQSSLKEQGGQSVRQLSPGNAFSKRSPSSVNSDYHSDSSNDWPHGTGSAGELFVLVCLYSWIEAYLIGCVDAVELILPPKQNSSETLWEMLPKEREKNF